MIRSVSILGSTGSIGTQTLDVIKAFPQHYRASVLVAGKSWHLLAEQARSFKPALVALGDKRHVADLKDALRGTGIKILAGPEGVLEAAAYAGADVVVSALVGIAGLEPTIAALEAGKPVALANKETLVVGGDIVTHLAARKGVPLIPVDSEHSAIFQCLQGQPKGSLKRILLTASGGPFRTTPREDLANMTAKEALCHPTWNMGAKVTVDSSSLMNKGFEILEAMHLFNVTMDKIEVWVHPQSIVHSMVEFVDGSVLAQCGPPNMRTPIQYALSWPERLPRAWSTLGLDHCRNLTFEAARVDDFPCLSYAFEAGTTGGSMPCVLNAANEIAVERFLAGDILFGGIPAIIRKAMDRHKPMVAPELADLKSIDRETRAFARELQV